MVKEFTLSNILIGGSKNYYNLQELILITMYIFDKYYNVNCDNDNEVFQVVSLVIKYPNNKKLDFLISLSNYQLF